MATLTVGDKSVTVGDEFLKLSSAEQDAAVADIAKSLGSSGEEPVTTNKVVRAAATGVPLVGGVLNKLNAATNATLAPVVEPFLAPSSSDISRRGETWRERFAKSEAMQNLADEQFAAQHPIVDTAAKVAGGVAGSIPMMTAAPAAFGLTGTLPQMVGRGALSNAAVGGADALIRGESPIGPAAVGGAVGAVAPLVARGAGAVARAVKDYRNPVAPVAQTVEDIAGVKVPVNQTGDPAIEAEKEIMRRCARGTSAEAIAKQADDEARAAIGQAEQGVSSMLDSAGAMSRTAPIAAAETVQQELATQAAAREAAAQQQALQVAGQGENLARSLAGGAVPATPLDAAEKTGAAVTKARNLKVAATREAYKARDAVPGTFDESVPRGLAEDVRTRLNSGENPIWVDPTNESVANRALKLIDQTLGRDSGVFSNAAAPKVGGVKVSNAGGDRYNIHDEAGNILAKAEIGIVNIGGKKLAQIDDIYTPGLEKVFDQTSHDAVVAGARHSLGTGQMRDAMRQFLRMHPDVEGFTGNRVSGARNAGRMNADNIQNINVKVSDAETVAALRKKFGDVVADAYAKQQAQPQRLTHVGWWRGLQRRGLQCRAQVGVDLGGAQAVEFEFRNAAIRRDPHAHRQRRRRIRVCLHPFQHALRLRVLLLLQALLQLATHGGGIGHPVCGSLLRGNAGTTKCERTEQRGQRPPPAACAGCVPCHRHRPPLRSHPTPDGRRGR